MAQLHRAIRRIKSPVPPGNAQRPPVTIDERSIIVRTSDQGRITIAQRHVDWRSVRANLERLHAEVPDAPVVIQPHPEYRPRR